MGKERVMKDDSLISSGNHKKGDLGVTCKFPLPPHQLKIIFPPEAELTNLKVFLAE